MIELCDCTHMSAGPLLVAQTASGYVVLALPHVPAGQRQIHLQDESRAMFVLLPRVQLWVQMFRCVPQATTDCKLQAHRRAQNVTASRCMYPIYVTRQVPHMRVGKRMSKRLVSTWRNLS